MILPTTIALNKKQNRKVSFSGGLNCFLNRNLVENALIDTNIFYKYLKNESLEDAPQNVFNIAESMCSCKVKIS